MLTLLLACAGDTTTRDSASPTDTAETTAPLVDGCHATPRVADDHALLVAFPYSADGGQSDLWRRFAYDGAVGPASEELTLGRAPWGRGAWTPDGAIALVVGDSGQVSSLHLESGELRTTTEPYVSSVTVDPTGETAWLVDGNWANNGGGLYRASLDCDTGHLGTPELVWTGKNASVLALRPGHPDQAAFISRELDGVPGVVHHVDLTAGTVLASVDVFGDDDAIVSDAVWDHEGQRLLVSDTSEFSGVPTRVGVWDVDAGVLPTIDVQDPVGLVAAPYDASSALVVSGYGDAAYELIRTADGYSLGPRVASLALPGAAVGVVAGGQQGHVVVSENEGLWALSFTPGGGVVDQGRLVAWTGFEGIPGGLALQP